MSERITRANLEARAENVNRRLRSGRFVRIEYRNGYTALDECQYSPFTTAPSDFSTLRTITVGSKREVADFLHAMMVGIDLYHDSLRA